MDIDLLFDRYKKFCYSFGRSLDRRPNTSIARMLYQADVEMTPGIFLSLWIVSSILAGLGMLALSAFLFLSPWSPAGEILSPLLMQNATNASTTANATVNPLAPAVVITLPATEWIYVGVLTLVGMGIVAAAFPFYLTNRISNKKMDIERQIPYALAFMSILAASGDTPIDVIRRIAQEDYGHISREFSKVLFRVDVLGEDAVTAMNDLVANTPSELFRSICIDLTNIIYGGGGLKEYLSMKSKDLMMIRRQAYREFVDSLAVFAEGYLGGIVMLITLGVLGIIIGGALSVEFSSFTPAQLLFMLIYVVTPVANVVFLQVLSVKYSTNP